MIPSLRVAVFSNMLAGLCVVCGTVLVAMGHADMDNVLFGAALGIAGKYALDRRMG